MASDLEGFGVGWAFAQASIALRSPADSRIAVTGSWPVAGLPRLLFRITDIANTLFFVVRYSELSKEVDSSPSSNPQHGVSHVSG